MKWKISAHYHSKNIEDWLRTMTEENVRGHLWSRGFNVWNDKKEIESLDGIRFSLKFEVIESIASIEIESKNWQRLQNKSSIPPIVFLIEDYFKIESIYWFYLETLNEDEMYSIENNTRNIDPFRVVSRLREINFDQQLLKPTLELLSNSASFNIDFYTGLEIDFDNITNFWISFLSWVSQSEFEYTNLNYILRNKRFHSDNGSCIPLKVDQTKNEINYSKERIDWFNENEIQKVYLMRKNFDDRVILFVLKEKYLVYHCWTNE